MLSFVDEQNFLVRLLRRAERYTKVDLMYIVRNSFWLIGSQFVTSVGSFLLAIAFGRFLSQESFGTYEYLMTIFGLVTLACLRGMDTLVLQAVARGNDATFWEGMYAKMRWGLLGSLASLVLAAYYFSHANTTVGFGLIAAALFVPLMDSVGLFGSILGAKKDFRLASILAGINQTTSAIAIAAALLLSHNPVIIFIAYCGAWTGMRGISLFVTLKKYSLGNGREPNALSYGWHASIVNAIGTTIGSIDGIAVYHFLGAADLAIYTFAMAPVLQARSFLATFSTVAIPKYITRTSKEIQETLLSRSTLLLAAGIVLTFAYIMLARPFFLLFFPKYLGAVVYSQVFSLTIAYQLAGTVVGTVLEGRTTLVPKKFLYLYNLPGIALALASVLLIQFIGIWGAIAGQFISMSTSFAIQIFMWLYIRNRDFALAVEAPLSEETYEETL